MWRMTSRAFIALQIKEGSRTSTKIGELMPLFTESCVFENLKRKGFVRPLCHIHHNNIQTYFNKERSKFTYVERSDKDSFNSRLIMYGGQMSEVLTEVGNREWMLPTVRVSSNIKPA